MTRAIFGPTFEEMLHPSAIDPAVRQRAIRAAIAAPLDPINLYNITWRGADDKIKYEVLPKELTGVEAPIVVLYGRDFPTGAHKVGAAYSVIAEALLFGHVDIDQHTVVWPSTGNYGIGGAWVGGRVGAKSIVVLLEGMSRERFERIGSYGAEVIKTPGVESNVKEIYDKTWELRRDPNIRILNQFEVMGNYRFHYHVTGNTIVELAAELNAQGIGNGSIAAFTSAMGSAGTIAAGDRIKQVWPNARTVGLEPIQCPTLYNNGYGGHDIQGIGDKHVTWIHNVLNMDAIACLDDIECKKGLQVLTSQAGQETLARRYGIAEAKLRQLGRHIARQIADLFVGPCRGELFVRVFAGEFIFGRRRLLSFQCHYTEPQRQGQPQSHETKLDEMIAPHSCLRSSYSAGARYIVTVTRSPVSTFAFLQSGSGI